MPVCGAVKRRRFFEDTCRAPNNLADTRHQSRLVPTDPHARSSGAKPVYDLSTGRSALIGVFRNAGAPQIKRELRRSPPLSRSSSILIRTPAGCSPGDAMSAVLAGASSIPPPPPIAGASPNRVAPAHYSISAHSSEVNQNAGADFAILRTFLPKSKTEARHANLEVGDPLREPAAPLYAPVLVLGQSEVQAGLSPRCAAYSKWPLVGRRFSS